MLLRCLASVRSQTLLNDGAYEVCVIVGDNNGDASASSLIAQLAPNFPISITSIHVAEPGLCKNRNALAQAALEVKAEVAVLIDDDEWAHPDWLANLVNGMQSTDADIMVGPVKTVFHPNTPQWFLDAGMSQTNPRNDKLFTGAPSPKFATHNTILKTEIFARVQAPWFPIELNFLGSEDQAFFWKARARGYNKIYWCSNAVVTEEFPLERADRKYFISRSLQRGGSMVLATQLVPSESSAWKGTCKEALRLFFGLPMIFSRKHRYRFIRHGLYVYGRILGHMGRMEKFYGA